MDPGQGKPSFVAATTFRLRSTRKASGKRTGGDISPRLTRSSSVVVRASPFARYKSPSSVASTPTKEGSAVSHHQTSVSIDLSCDSDERRSFRASSVPITDKNNDVVTDYPPSGSCMSLMTEPTKDASSYSKMPAKPATPPLIRQAATEERVHYNIVSGRRRVDVEIDDDVPRATSSLRRRRFSDTDFLYFRNQFQTVDDSQATAPTMSPVEEVETAPVMVDCPTNSPPDGPISSAGGTNSDVTAEKIELVRGESPAPTSGQQVICLDPEAAVAPRLKSILSPLVEESVNASSFTEEMLGKYEAVETATLGSPRRATRSLRLSLDDDESSADGETPDTTDMTQLESPSLQTVGSPRDDAPDIHLYNDPNGRFHVVVDASKFSTTLPRNVVSGLKATVSADGPAKADPVSQGERAVSTKITVRRRKSLYRAMENSVMPGSKKPAFSFLAALRARRRPAKDAAMDKPRGGSPQLSLYTSTSDADKKMKRMRRTQSVEVLPVATTLFDSSPLSPTARRPMRAASLRQQPRPTSDVFPVDSAEADGGGGAQTAQAQVFLTDHSPRTRVRRNSLTITLPGGRKLELKPPMKAKEDMTGEDMRQHVLITLLQTEVSYVESLRTLTRVYLEPLRDTTTPNLIDDGLLDEIFFQIPDLKQCHETFLHQLSERMTEDPDNQKIGDVFLNSFSKCMLSQSYSAFIGHYLQAKNALKEAEVKRPAFSKFLEQCGRKHDEKLALNDLLIKPVQRIPRYVLLLKDILMYTPEGHSDYDPLKSAIAELTTLVEKIDQSERMANEAEKLKELEYLFDGNVGISAPNRCLIFQEPVMEISPDNQMRERMLILLSDMVVCASKTRNKSVKRRASTFLFLNLPSSENLPKHNLKLNFMARIADIVQMKSLESSVPKPWSTLISPPSLSSRRQPSVHEKVTLYEKLRRDEIILENIRKFVDSLYVNHGELEGTLKTLETEVHKQMEVQQESDRQLSLVKCRVGLIVDTRSEGTRTFTFQFMSVARKKLWIEEFEKAKRAVLAEMDLSSSSWDVPSQLKSETPTDGPSDPSLPTQSKEPAFYKAIPLMKTRGGMKISCACSTIESDHLWISATDGSLGQVWVINVDTPVPQFCITVCASKITCITAIPAAESAGESRSREGSTPARLRKLSALVHRSRSSFSGDCEWLKKKTAIANSALPKRSQSFAARRLESDEPDHPRHRAETVPSLYPVVVFQLNKAGSVASLCSTGSSADLSEQLARIPGPESEACIVDPVSSTTKPETEPETEPLRSPTPPMLYVSLSELHDKRNSSPEDDQKEQEGEGPSGHEPTMWLGTADGSALVYRGGDSVRRKPARFDFRDQIEAMTYMESNVFIALKNGHVFAISCPADRPWKDSRPEEVKVPEGKQAVSCLCVVRSHLWCSKGNQIHMVCPKTLTTENTFSVHDDEAKHVVAMVSVDLAVYVALTNSSEVRLFHASSHQQLAKLDIRQDVKNMLSTCNEIVRQHKMAKLRVTCLQLSDGLLWIGSSAGVLLTMPLPSVGPDGKSVGEMPKLSSSYHGHTGLVRFVTTMKRTRPPPDVAGSSARTRTRRRGSDIEAEYSPRNQRSISDTSTIDEEEEFPGVTASTNGSVMDVVVVSGGDGFEDFRTSGDVEADGRDDSTSHILTWHA